MKTQAMMILNRDAATGRSDDEVAGVLGSFQQHFSFADRRVAVVETHSAARATARAFRSSYKGFGVIVVGGGAGTLRAVAEGLCAGDGRVPDPDSLSVAPLRLGSGNVLAKTFGVPDDTDEALLAAAINVRLGSIERCAVIRCVVDGTVRFAMTLVGLGQFSRIPGDLARWHAGLPRTRRGLAGALGVERLTHLEYQTDMLIRGARCWVRPDQMETVEVQTNSGPERIRLLAGAVANFPIKGLPFKPNHGPGESLLSGYLLRDAALSPLNLLPQRRAVAAPYRFEVSESDSLVMRLLSPGPAEFFLDEDSMTFSKELRIGIAGTLGIVPGVVKPESVHRFVNGSTFGSEESYGHARVYSGN